MRIPIILYTLFPGIVIQLHVLKLGNRNITSLECDEIQLIMLFVILAATLDQAKADFWLKVDWRRVLIFFLSKRKRSG